MTGLLNRKSLENAFYSAVLEDLDNSVSSARMGSSAESGDLERRHRVPANYWLGSALVDNFGLIHAKHGPLVVEEVLSLVARVMNNTFRTYDRIYRFGGEHYGVLMHCPDEALVLAAFERFRANVEKFKFPQVGRITVSCGFTSVMENDSPSSALDKTQRAVDFAKRSGGNKACSYLGLERRGFFRDAPKLATV
jgi:diguanylate cyclase (GGDEF)-like protein